MFTVASPFTDERPYDYVAFDTYGRYTWVSDHTARKFGHTRQSMLGRHVRDLFPAAVEFAQLLTTVVDRREAATSEIDSTVLNTRILVRAYPTDDGVEVYYTPLSDDVRSRQEAARMIALITVLNSARDYDEVISHILEFLGAEAYGVIIALRDDQNRVTIAHRHGYANSPERRGLSAPLQALLTAVMLTRRLAVLSRAQALERHPDLQLAAETAELVIVPLITSGEAVGAILMSLAQAGTTDVVVHSRLSVLAGQCAAAICRTRLYAQAQHDRARFRTLLDATSDIVLELDADLHVRHPLPSWEAFTGQGYAQYRGLGYLDAVHPDHRADLDVLLTTEQLVAHPVEFAGRLRNAHGEYRDVHAQVVPVVEDGRVGSWIGTVQDVTETRRRERWARRTHDFMLAVGSARSAQETYDRVLTEIASLLRCDRGGLMATARPGEPLTLLSTVGIDEHLVPVVRRYLLSVAPENLRKPTVRWTEWTHASGPLADLNPHGNEEHVLVPLVLGDTFVGQLVFVARKDARPDADLLAYLATLLPQVAHTLQRAMLQGALERREAEAQAILATLEEGIALLDAHGRVVAANDALDRMTGPTPPLRDLRDLVARSAPALDAAGRPLPAGAHPAERALHGGHSVRGEIVQRALPQRHPQWLSVTALPIDSGGQVSGVVVSMADVTDSVQIERQLEALALEDDLTGLPNRRALMRTLDALPHETGEPCALLLVDLDGFKLVNDSLGHVQGDTLLRTVAALLREATSGQAAQLSRLSGDEFCVLLAGTDSSSATATASRLQDALRRPCQLDGTEVQVSASIGLAVCGVNGTRSTDLYRNASLALLDARASGGNRVSEYREALGTSHIRRAEVERHLRAALSRRDLNVAYQPIVDVNDPAYIGFEALARWHDPDLGPVSPAEFIPVAESTGLIHELGLQILDAALRQGAAWTRAWARPVHVSVNVSASQFMRPGFVDTIVDLVRTSDLPPHRLTLEVTEAVAIHNLDDVVAQLRVIRSTGVRIALDDFGTGFSSLAVLERLPIDTLKLDRALVAGIHRSPRRLDLLTAVILITQRLSLTVVAEGVEDAEELDLLRRVGCARVQGYHISRPKAAAEFPPPDPAPGARPASS